MKRRSPVPTYRLVTGDWLLGTHTMSARWRGRLWVACHSSWMSYGSRMTISYWTASVSSRQKAASGLRPAGTRHLPCSRTQVKCLPHHLADSDDSVKSKCSRNIHPRYLRCERDASPHSARDAWSLGGCTSQGWSWRAEGAWSNPNNSRLCSIISWSKLTSGWAPLRYLSFSFIYNWLLIINLS